MKTFNLSSVLYVLIILSSCLWDPSEQHKHKYKDCIHWCGDISIPYPFGIGPDHCSYSPSFAVSCNNTTSTSTQSPILKIFNLEIIEIRKYAEELLVKIPSVTTCNGTETNYWRSPNLFNSSFSYSGSYGNTFVSVGCSGYAFFDCEQQQQQRRHSVDKFGCTSTCAPDHQESYSTHAMKQCYGFNNCCQIEYEDCDSYSITVSANNGSENCRSAFLISREHLKSVASTPAAMSAVPVMLAWSIGSPTSVTGLDLPSVLLLIVGVSTALPLCFIWLCWWHNTKRGRKDKKLRNKYFSRKLKEQQSIHEEVRKSKLFTKRELTKATDNFNEDRIIGKGGQGTVYKGILSDGTLVAIKKSMSLIESQWREFINEVIILSQVNHRNIVKLLGCCLETKYILLVYEFIPNGTLSDLIHNPDDDFVLTWDVRLRIAAEVAGAIAYLHSTSTTPILHRDIKSMNILLDHKYTAKLCDFGISRSTTIDQTHLTTLVKGTFGYFDPQYFRSNQYTEKSDVYSFGVVLFEILTAQKPIRQHSDGDATSVVMEFASLMDYTALYEMLDPIIRTSNTFKADDIMGVIKLAKRCLHSEGAGRPTMTQVSLELVHLNRKCSTKSDASQKEENSDISQEYFSTKTHLDEGCSFKYDPSLSESCM